MLERGTIGAWFVGALLVACSGGNGATDTPCPGTLTTQNDPKAPSATSGSGQEPSTGKPDEPKAPSSALPDDDLGAAQAFVKSLTLGVNVERGWAWSLPGQDSANKTSYWTYLHDTAHFTHVRLFYPWRPSLAMGGGGANNAAPDKQAFGRILDAAEQAIKAGLTVFVDCTDVMGVEDFTGGNGQQTEQHMQNCAAWTAERNLDKAKLAIGAVNEWAGGDDNETYNDLRQKYHDVLRAKLPGYVLTTGPGYWKSRDWIYDPSKKFKTFSDLRVLYEWHHYSSLDANGWKAEAQKLAAWRQANGGRPTICGEAGAGYWDEQVNGKRLAQAPEAWPTRFAAQLPAIANEHPSVWAVTYGGDYRVNKTGDDPFLMDGSNGSPNLLDTFVKAGAAMKANLAP